MRTLLGSPVMTNFDHSIDEEVATRLRENPDAQAEYTGWNFIGYVSWVPEVGHYTCEVWQYHSPRETFEGSLQEIMAAVCETYGSE